MNFWISFNISFLSLDPESSFEECRRIQNERDIEREWERKGNIFYFFLSYALEPWKCQLSFPFPLQWVPHIFQRMCLLFSGEAAQFLGPWSPFKGRLGNLDSAPLVDWQLRGVPVKSESGSLLGAFISPPGPAEIMV